MLIQIGLKSNANSDWTKVQWLNMCGQLKTLFRGYSSAVEHLVANENVARSNRVTRFYYSYDLKEIGNKKLPN